MKVLEMRLIHHKVAGPALEHGHDVGGDVHSHAGLGFDRGRPDVGRAVKMLHLEQWLFRINRLLFKHVKGRRGEHTTLKRFEDGLLVNDSPTSTVDDVASAGSTVVADVGHGGQSFGVHQVVGFFGQVAVNRNVGAVGKQRIDGLVQSSALGFGYFRGQVRVVGVNLHAEGLRHTTNRLGDSSETDETEGFS